MYVYTNSQYITLTVLGDTLPSLLAMVFPNIPFFSNRRNVILTFGLFCVCKNSVDDQTYKYKY
jgi:hypothetical protein